MAKYAYIEKKFRPESMQMIRTLDAIIKEYQAQSLRLTLRQLYYQCVARDIIPNKEESYKNLSNLLSNARLAGLIDWNAIEDRVRVPRKPSEWANLKDLVESAVYGYRLDRWEGQDNYIELWVEKDAIANVLSPISRAKHITLMVNRGYCVSPSTRVLTADLRWIPASTVSSGQKLIACDEEVPGPKQHRKMRIATVESTTRFTAPRVRVVTDRGPIIVSTNHPFLATRYTNPKIHGYHWVCAEDLKVGARIAFLAQPWAEDTSWDAGWLAGVYDGEGCLPSTTKSRVLAVYQNEGLVAAKIRALLSDREWLDAESCKKSGGVVDFRTYSAGKILELLGTVRPLRIMDEFLRQVRRGKWPAKGKAPATVLSIERLTPGPVVGIETSTGTLITEGYVSHNSSQSAMYESAARFRRATEEGKENLLFYLGDLDPSGEDMVRDIEDRLKMFEVEDLTVEKIALNYDQVQKYKPPPNPAKFSDPRSKGYVEKFGKYSWEVDALNPRTLTDLINDAIEPHIDQELMDAVIAREDLDKQKLRKAAKEIMEGKA